MIAVGRHEGGDRCDSGNAEHSGDAVVVLAIGSADGKDVPATHMLCTSCARRVVEMLLSRIKDRPPPTASPGPGVER
jgi:hypothetical protein